MKVGAVSSCDVWSNVRLDAKFHLDEGNRAFRRVMSGKWELTTPSEQFGKTAIWAPNRFARVYAAEPAFGKPILVPYDVFRFIPASDKFLSRSQVAVYDSLELKRGWLLMTCSGRNLGPVTLVDDYCARFVMSHDMIRVAAPLNDDLLYFTAFLHTSVGQALVRRDKNGSVIDHIGPAHVAAMHYPLVSPSLRAEAARLFKLAFTNREQAREIIRVSREKFLVAAGLESRELQITSADRRRFSVDRIALKDRIDAEPYAPIYEAYRRHVKKWANGVALSEITEVHKPAGRYKTLYVEQARYGVPLMSGRQIAQYRPIGLKHMSPAAFKKPDQYCVRAGTILVTADGRAEENLADTAMITSARDGWMASGHVHRLTPRDGVHPGLVYLAVSCAPVQAQLKSLATGSVVDALSVEDVGSVTVPVPDGHESLAHDAMNAWSLFANAEDAEQEAIGLLEEELLA